MRCPNCGRVNRHDALFCDACGVRVTGPRDAAEHPRSGKGVPPRSEGFRSESLMSEGAFVGRQQEMEALKAAFEEARSGRGRLLMLVGEPGIGKTRTAQELAAYAGVQGALVLWGRCYETPGAPPYWPWVQVVRTCMQTRDDKELQAQMGTGATDIAEIVPEVRERLPDLPSVLPLVDAEQARFRLLDAVTTFLKRAAHEQPLVMVLDNLHWADRPSLLLLEFLAREVGTSQILVVGTYRDLDVSRQHPLSETLAELTRERLLQRLLLRGLSQEDVGDFLGLATGSPPPLELIDAVHRQTEGNPLFVTEVVRLLVQEGGLASAGVHQQRSLSIEIPAGVREVIGRRLNRLPPACLQVLSVASVIGREFSLDELRGAIGNPPAESLLDALDAALAARILEEVSEGLGRYQFSHVLIRETLYDELTAPRRARLHLRVGEALEALYQAHLDPHLPRLAYHFAEAAQVSEVAKAIDYAERAGIRANALLAYEEALHHYANALRLLEVRPQGDEAWRCRLLLALGEAQSKAGEHPQALETFRRAADSAKALGSPEDLARAALGFEDTSWRPGLPGHAAIQLLEEALRALGEGDSGLKARLLAALSRALIFSGWLDQAEVIRQQAVRMARRLSDAATLAATLRVSLSARWRPENLEARLADAAEVVRLAQEAGDRALMLEAASWRLFDLMELGDLPAVDIQLQAHKQLAEELRQPFYLYVNVSFQVMRAIFAGHFEDGERLAQEALAIGQRLRGQDEIGVFGVQMFTLRREQGRLQEVAPAVRHFVRTSPESSRWRPGLALIYSELGLTDEARAEFEAMAAHNFADIPRDGMWVTCMAYLAEVCAFLGDARRAALLYQALLPYAQRNIVVGTTVACFGAACRFLGMLAATMGHWEEAQQHFLDALEMNTRVGAKPWLAHTQYRYADMLFIRGKPGDVESAEVLLNEALATSSELGMHGLKEQALALLQRKPTKAAQVHTYPRGLSQREVEVLRLVAAGKSNRDIAEELFISLYTVASHVRNILAKIGAANRTEAAAYATRQGLIDSPPSPPDNATS